MKLDDFLNFKKVRCVKGHDDCLTVGKEYSVLDIHTEVKVKDDEGAFLYLESDYFEPVLDSAKNPLQDVELTPEFEAVEPKFRVGDKVYIGLTGKIRKIDSFNSNDGSFTYSHNDITTYSKNKDVVKATQENYEMLCKLYPHIEFEQPPKPLSGSDLARDLIKKGWKGFTCVCGNSGDDNVMITTIVTGTNNSGQFVDFKGRFFNNAMPMLGSYPLTQAVLDE